MIPTIPVPQEDSRSKEDQKNSKNTKTTLLSARVSQLHLAKGKGNRRGRGERGLVTSFVIPPFFALENADAVEERDIDEGVLNSRNAVA